MEGGKNRGRDGGKNRGRDRGREEGGNNYCYVLLKVKI